VALAAAKSTTKRRSLLAETGYRLQLAQALVQAQRRKRRDVVGKTIVEYAADGALASENLPAHPSSSLSSRK